MKKETATRRSPQSPLTETLKHSDSEPLSSPLLLCLLLGVHSACCPVLLSQMPPLPPAPWMASTGSLRAASIIPNHFLCPDQGTLPVSLHLFTPPTEGLLPGPAISPRATASAMPANSSFIHPHMHMPNTRGASSVSWALGIELHGVGGPSLPLTPTRPAPSSASAPTVPEQQPLLLPASTCPLSLPICSFYLWPHASSVFAKTLLSSYNTLCLNKAKSQLPPRSCCRATSLSQCYVMNCVPHLSKF